MRGRIRPGALQGCRPGPLRTARFRKMDQRASFSSLPKGQVDQKGLPGRPWRSEGAMYGYRSDLCHLNGRVLPLAEARIDPRDREFQFGDALYEGFGVLGGLAPGPDTIQS